MDHFAVFLLRMLHIFKYLDYKYDHARYYEHRYCYCCYEWIVRDFIWNIFSNGLKDQQRFAIERVVSGHDYYVNVFVCEVGPWEGVGFIIAGWDQHLFFGIARGALFFVDDGYFWTADLCEGNIHSNLVVAFVGSQSEQAYAVTGKELCGLGLHQGIHHENYLTSALQGISEAYLIFEKPFKLIWTQYFLIFTGANAFGYSFWAALEHLKGLSVLAILGAPLGETVVAGLRRGVSAGVQVSLSLMLTQYVCCR